MGVRVGILGGMGPAAGVTLAQHFVQACEVRLRALGQEVNDQSFPEHYLIQCPFPDRTRALLDQGAADPGPAMSLALGKLEALGVSAAAIACNTAHAWHRKLQEAHPKLELLHVVELVRDTLVREGVKRAGLLATRGTYASGLYGNVLARAGILCAAPCEEERAELMRGIYQGVKAANFELARSCFRDVAESIARRHALECLILGCTEIPLTLTTGDLSRKIMVIDPARLLATALAERALLPS